MEKELYIPLTIAIVFFIIIWLRHRYIEWQEDKQFWKQVNFMIENDNKRFMEAFEKTMQEMKPFIVDIVEKKRNSNTPE